MDSGNSNSADCEKSYSLEMHSSFDQICDEIRETESKYEKNGTSDPEEAKKMFLEIRQKTTKWVLEALDTNPSEKVNIRCMKKFLDNCINNKMMYFSNNKINKGILEEIATRENYERSPENTSLSLRNKDIKSY